ncbi:hypothetical protein L210DRAFT_2055698 [Boletus edulis BED1]|uniref:Uncharacterized protein n=1 Tax=Boletus edulis BED1 TaxID=1328754 RepID=A0AAD4GLS9_BOLED|nr:hypothetical protein L210DRAFT_2055698 [Boletus edulis BED1]
MVMILRVYAMYNRSKIILGVLFVMYVTETIILVITSSIYSDPTYAAVSMVQLLDVTVCTVNFSIQSWNNAATIIQFILGAILCILAAAQFVRNLLEMHRVTRKWQLNRYMNLLVRDGLLYFLVTVLHSLLTMLGILNALPQGWVSQVLAIIANVPLITLTPRFVMNIRELYLYDVQNRWDHDIDSGFGLSSGTGRGVGGLVTIGMEFVDGGRTEMLEDGEEMAALERRVESGGRHLVVV